MQPSRDEIIALIAEEARIDPARLKPEASLAALGIASLDVMTVLFAIEDRWGVEIQPEALTGADTLDDFVTRVTDRIAAA